MQADSIVQSPTREVWSVHHQYIAFLVIAAAMIGMTALQIPSSRANFDLYFGGLPSIVVVAAAGAVGVGALAALGWMAGFQIFSGRTTLRGIAVSAGFATLLAVVIVIADLLIRYPENTNVPVPRALLFYPTVGFVAEVVFHLLPLMLLMLALSALQRRLGTDCVVRIAIVITAVAEPTFQILFKGERLTWMSAYTWIHVFAIAILQLQVFRRYDFASMYMFRLIYYAYWHIIWGVIRLKVLF
jgi:hypothetical protein